MVARIYMWLRGRRLNSCDSRMHDLTGVLCRWRPYPRLISILVALVEKSVRFQVIKACGGDVFRSAHFELRRPGPLVSA